MLGAQTAAIGDNHSPSHGAGGPRLRGDRLYRTVQWRRPHLVGNVDHPGDHRAGQRQGLSAGRLVVLARAEQGSRDDGFGTRQCCPGGFAESSQPATLEFTPACVRTSRRAPSMSSRYDAVASKPWNWALPLRVSIADPEEGQESVARASWDRHESGETLCSETVCAAAGTITAGTGPLFLCSPWCS